MYPQLRDLRAEPDPREPSYSDEESFVNCQPLFVQNEDDIHQKIDRSCHRISNSCATGSSHERSTKESTNKDSRRSLNHMKTEISSPIYTKSKRRQKDRDRAKERSCKLESFTSGSDRGKIVDTTTDLSDTRVDGDDSEPGGLSTLHLTAAPKRVVSMTPDNFNALMSLNSIENGIDRVENGSPQVVGPLHHYVEGSCELENSLNSDQNGVIFRDSRHSRKGNVKSISNMTLNRIDLNPNERLTKLSFSGMNLCCSTTPTHVLCGTPLGGTLQNLSLSGNPLRELPPTLVVGLPALQILDVSKCQLHQLPQEFCLPNLRVLNLGYNLLTEFPNENLFTGLPNLCELRMNSNRLTDITLPANVIVMSKLEILDLGFNYISAVPIELDQLLELRHLSIANNFLTRVPMRICEMKLHCLDVSCNAAITEPPIHICELGIIEMRQYWLNVRMEVNTIKNTTNISFTRVSRKGKRSLTRFETLSRGTTLSDLSESTTGREESIGFSLRSTSSLTIEDGSAAILK